MSTTANIINRICAYYKINSTELLGKHRVKAFAVPRQMAMYLLREVNQYYFTEIATLFNRHHATIIHGYDTIAGLLQIGHKKTIQEVAELTEIIKREEGEIIEGVIGDSNQIPEIKQSKRKIWRSKHHNNVKNHQ